MWDVLVGQVVVNRFEIGFPRDVGNAQQRLDLARECEPSSRFVIHEGLLPETIAGEQKPLARLVPESEREHPTQPRHDRVAPLLISMDDGLDVGMGPEAMAEGLELGAQLDVVVDLAVEDHVPAAVLAVQRLRASGDVDDRQSAK